MPALIAIYPDGRKEVHQVKKLDLDLCRKLIGNGCELVERTKVRYGGKLRDVWLDEEGWTKPNIPNPHIKRMVEDAYPQFRGCQDFAGVGVVWVPGDTTDKSDPPETFGA
jgi:hypothetical protein